MAMGTETAPAASGLTPEAEPIVRGSLFPMQVHLPDGSVVRWAKVVVTAERIYVFTQASSREVTTTYEAVYSQVELPSPLAPRSDPVVAVTADGELVARRLPGCGCAHATLKAFQPFTPMRYAAAV